ncbi:MAG: PorT family protein [Dysgonamonadaceae bacterium]|jgi:hypothetical protein|nr:PorT family protein [Dysgonamonadaceae bacterium]
MKNLVKLSVVSAFLLIVFVSQAQVSYGVKAGLNVSTLSGFSKSAETKFKSGSHVGLIGHVELFSPSFFIQPELLFSQEGMKEKDGKKFINHTLNYLQLPMYLGYKMDVGSDLNVIVGVGPYLAYGLSGTNKVFKKELNRFDAGVSAMGGIQFEKIQITAGYDFGFSDIRKGELKKAKDLSRISNRNFKVSLAYLF